VSANGRLLPSEIVVVDAFDTRLLRATANMWARLQADAAQAGHHIWITVQGGKWGAIGGYRDLAEQTFLQQNPLGPVAIGTPGYQSHGTGRALDISTEDADAQRWLEKNAKRYGLTQTYGAKEPWHWLHNGLTLAASLANLPPIPTTEEEMMALKDKFALLKGAGSPVWLIRLDDDGAGKTGDYRQLKPAELTAYVNAGLAISNASDAEALDMLAGPNPWASEAK
jgi:hypothetical protein